MYDFPKFDKDRAMFVVRQEYDDDCSSCISWNRDDDSKWGYCKFHNATTHPNYVCENFRDWGDVESAAYYESVEDREDEI